MKILLLVLSAFILAGCAAANVTAVMRPASSQGYETRCEPVDLRDKKDVEAVTKQYDGWQLIYVSEFTTSNRFGTSAAMCFERLAQPTSPAHSAVTAGGV